MSIYSMSDTGILMVCWILMNQRGHIELSVTWLEEKSWSVRKWKMV
jgi:hypothetical protein